MTVLYPWLKNQAELSVVSSGILALSPITTNRLPGAKLRWATVSDDKQTKKKTRYIHKQRGGKSTSRKSVAEKGRIHSK